jgi:hypothetical protein
MGLGKEGAPGLYEKTFKDKSAYSGIGAPPRIFAEESGYIPVKLYELSKNDNISFVMPGPGAPWAEMHAELWFPTSLSLTPGALDTVAGNSMGDIAGHAVACCLGIPSSGRMKDKPTKSDMAQRINPFDQAITDLKDWLGAELTSVSPGQCWWSATNIKSLSKRLESNKVRDPVEVVNIIGHSRGGVAAIMASHDIHDLFPKAKINIFAIDPVPGTGNLTYKQVTLSKGVTNYVGIYALDERSGGFNGIVPNYHNDKGVLTKPLELGGAVQNNKRPFDDMLGGGYYRCIYSPGRHGTVAGMKTSDGTAEGKIELVMNYSEYVAVLVFRLAKSYFTSWGTKFPAPAYKPRGDMSSGTMQLYLQGDHAKEYFKKMRKTTYNTGSGGGILYFEERGVTSSEGRDGRDWEYLEEVIGIANRGGIGRGYRNSRYDKAGIVFNHQNPLFIEHARWEPLVKVESSHFKSIPPS